MSEYQALRQFLNAYLYMYYTDDYGDEWNALKAYVEESDDAASPLQSDIASLLSAGRTEAEISHVMKDDIRWGYDITLTGETWRGWLTKISAEAGRLAGEAGPPS